MLSLRVCPTWLKSRIPCFVPSYLRTKVDYEWRYVHTYTYVPAAGIVPTMNHDYLGLGQLTQSHLVPHSAPGFSKSCNALFVFWLVESLIIFKKHILIHRTVGDDTLLLTNNSVRRLSILSTTAVQRGGLVVALGVHVVVVHTPMTHVKDDTTPRCLLTTR